MKEKIIPGDYVRMTWGAHGIIVAIKVMPPECAYGVLHVLWSNGRLGKTLYTRNVVLVSRGVER